MDEYQTPELEEGQSLRVRFRRKRRKPRWLIALLVFVLPILVGAAVMSTSVRIGRASSRRTTGSGPWRGGMERS